MKPRYCILVGLLFSLACGPEDGCNVGEKLTVIYRGPEGIVERAPVRLNGDDVGHIDSIVESQKGMEKRLSLTVRDAAAFTTDSTFRWVVNEDDGYLHVTLGAGAPLKPGDVVDADPLFRKRRELARRAKETGGTVTLPTGEFVPYPEALTAAHADRRVREHLEFQEDMEERLEFEAEDFNELPADLTERYEQLPDRLLAKSPEDALRSFDDHARPLLRSLREAERVYRKEGNRQAAKQAEKLFERLEEIGEKLEKKTGREKRKRRRGREAEEDRLDGSESFED